MKCKHIPPTNVGLMRCIVPTSRNTLTRSTTSEFFSFAKTWYRLADEIDYCERLISFIDAVAASVSMKEDPERAELESGVNSLMRLTAAIVAISNRFAADRFATAEE